MWFIGVEVEQETSAPPPKKNPGSTPVLVLCLPDSWLDWNQQQFLQHPINLHISIRLT